MQSPYSLSVIDSCVTCKLREDRLFCNLKPDALANLDRIKFSTSYAADAVLFMEGQPPTGVMILCQGRVKLSVTSAEGKTVILSIAEPGEVLGMSSAISGKPHEATAESLEPVQVNIIRRNDFLEFLKKFQEVSLHAAQELSHVHNTACREIRMLGLSQSVQEKLANLILQWDERVPNSKGRLKVTLTHEEIAQLLGTSRETVTRTLNDLKKKKVIAIKGVSMQIMDRDRLQKMASVPASHV
ncbi:MAG: Crp/Fnr family transcriptional regulator [Acidobacteriales bacterium]|nr:Crp/Fnr family transcriptional regulator [Terriglobales bacterium]